MDIHRLRPGGVTGSVEQGLELVLALKRKDKTYADVQLVDLGKAFEDRFYESTLVATRIYIKVLRHDLTSVAETGHGDVAVVLVVAVIVAGKVG